MYVVLVCARVCMSPPLCISIGDDYVLMIMYLDLCVCEHIWLCQCVDVYVSLCIFLCTMCTYVCVPVLCL